VTLTHRLARRDDLDALRALMDAAISELQKPFLDESQIASSRTIMGLDTQLIDDGTYFIVEAMARSQVAADGAAEPPCMAVTSRRGATLSCSTRRRMQRGSAPCTPIRTTHAKAGVG
jgi:hypothetical protein